MNDYEMRQFGFLKAMRNDRVMAARDAHQQRHPSPMFVRGWNEEMERLGAPNHYNLDYLAPHTHTRTDDTLVAWIAAPIWFLVWCLTFGRWGKPLWRYE